MNVFNISEFVAMRDGSDTVNIFLAFYYSTRQLPPKALRLMQVHAQSHKINVLTPYGL